MIRDNQSISPTIDRQTGIFHVHDALDDQGTTPAALDPFHIVPA